MSRVLEYFLGQYLVSHLPSPEPVQLCPGANGVCSGRGSSSAVKKGRRCVPSFYSSHQSLKHPAEAFGGRGQLRAQIACRAGGRPHQSARRVSVRCSGRGTAPRAHPSAHPSRERTSRTASSDAAFRVCPSVQAAPSQLLKPVAAKPFLAGRTLLSGRPSSRTLPGAG